MGHFVCKEATEPQEAGVMGEMAVTGGALLTTEITEGALRTAHRAGQGYLRNNRVFIARQGSLLTFHN